jgi:hypothetical protein
VQPRVPRLQPLAARWASRRRRVRLETARGLHSEPAMVLYNSPLAVGLLVATLLCAGTGALLVYARLYRFAFASGREARFSGESPPLQQGLKLLRARVVSGALAIVAVLGFWIVLAAGTFHAAFQTPASFRLPSRELVWSPPTRPALTTRFDRFALPGSASQAERLRRHRGER